MSASPSSPRVVPIRGIGLHDNDDLGGRTDELEGAGGILDPNIRDWRSQCPDDPKSSLVQARIPDRMVHTVDALLSRARGYAWSNRSDFIREALWYYIRGVTSALRVRDETIASLVAEQELAGRAAFAAGRRVQLDQSIHDCREYLTDLLNADDLPEASRFLVDLVVRVRSIRLRAWREQWFRDITNLPILQITVRLLASAHYDIPPELEHLATATPASTPRKIPGPGGL